MTARTGGHRLAHAATAFALALAFGACSNDEPSISTGTSIPATASATATGTTPAAPGTSVAEAPCTPDALEAAYRASVSATPTGVGNIRCAGTWALADIETVETGTTDMTQLFQANGLVWSHMGDVVPVEQAELERLGVPAADAARLLAGPSTGIGR